MTAIEIDGTAAKQGASWGARAAEWAELQEHYSEPLFEAALAKCGVAKGTNYLDVGCGAGLAASMAAFRMATVAGLDASAEMLAVARRRTPGVDFRLGDMQKLPWRDASFDLVTFFNSLQYAASDVDALREAARVTRPGGCIAVAAWAEPERCEAAPYIAALGTFVPAAASDIGGPWSFSEPMALRTLFESAGLTMWAMREVNCAWTYRDAGTALRALMTGGTVARAIDAAGEPRVRDAVFESIAPFRRCDGSYRIENVFRLAIGKEEV
ncbi:MAG TPA: class I SAM-dependent methyltransferase [Thermoanaerobaculia bacterium]|jgi:SAM-dependent methyltransferase|nr:class I SAM-dependent methyltransferase [Thermoanaerobaculia bacterium]